LSDDKFDGALCNELKQKLEGEGYSKFVDIRYPDEMAKLDEI
jgi:hypothetical protein